MKPIFQSVARILCLLLLALPGLLSAQAARLVFTAHLNGAQEVPAVPVAAEGLVTITVSDDLKSMTIHGVYSGLSGTPTAAHFHTGKIGVSGPVTLGLADLLIGNDRILGQKPLSKALLQQMLAGQIYFNVHTAANPGGEIRGQVVAEADTHFTVLADGAQETPAVTTAAIGVGTVSYKLGDDVISVSLSATGLSGPITAAHIHTGPVGVAGPVLVPLTITGNTVTGNFPLSSLPANFLQKIDSGQFYLNLHTAAHPAGEIRGQLHHSAPFSGVATLSGAEETPPVTTTATGTGWVSINSTLDSLSYAMLVTGLTPTAAHIHRGAKGVAGPVLIPFTATATPGFYTGKVAADSALIASLLTEGLYFNAHSAAHPAGEIRGQIEPNVRLAFGFDLCGSQETPPNSSNGLGAGVVSIDRDHTALHYAVAVDGLGSSVAAAHIHKGVPGIAGPVLIPIDLPTPYSAGVAEASDSIFAFLNTGILYMNVHTADFPGGEVRGQVRDSISCALSSGVEDLRVQALEVFPNPLQSTLNLRFHSRDAFKGRLRLLDMTGRVVLEQTMAVSGGEQSWSLPLPALQAGMYYLAFQEQDRLIFYYKLVKM